MLVEWAMWNAMGRAEWAVVDEQCSVAWANDANLLYARSKTKKSAPT